MAQRLTNDYLNVRLISLARWCQAGEIQPRDQRGPYIVAQEGYDPADPHAAADEFVLGRDGRWVPLARFFAAPREERRRHFVFGTAAEVMQLLAHLPAHAEVAQGVGERATEADPEAQELRTVIEAARHEPVAMEAQGLPPKET